MVGCSTFPTWNSYPGLFASLVTGNAVIVKPHLAAMLPLATVAVARDVLAEAGFSPDLVLLAAEGIGEGLASTLAVRPEVRIDYTGSTEYGRWLEDNARQAEVYTEKSGVNVVVVDSTDDYRGMLSNIAFSLSLYSGQMCTTPQNILVPRDGLVADGASVSVEQFGRDLADAVTNLLGDDRFATALLGGIVNEGVLSRIDAAPSFGDVVLESRSILHPEFPDAVVRRRRLFAWMQRPMCTSRSVSDRSRSSSPPMTPRQASTCCVRRCGNTAPSRRLQHSDGACCMQPRKPHSTPVLRCPPT